MDKNKTFFKMKFKNMERGVSRKTVFLLLFCLVLFHLINNYIVLENNHSAFYCDSSFYILQSFERYESISHDRYLEAYYAPTRSYPILYYLLSVPFYFVFGVKAISPIMTNSIFLIILVFSVYGIGAKLHSRGAGLLSAFITTFFPHVFSLSRTYLFDYPLLALVSFSIFCLLKTENFKNRQGSVLFGLAVGFSALIKPHFIIFLIGPLTCYFYNGFVKEGLSRHKKFINLVLAFIISLFLGGLGYLPPHLDSFLASVTHTLHYWNDLTLFSMNNITYYLQHLINIQVFPFYFLLFILSLKMYSVDKYKSLFCFLWFFIPYLFFTFVILNVKDMRWLVPCLPALALLISLNTFTIKSLTVKKVIVSLILIIGLSQFFVVSYYLNDKVLHLFSPNFRFNPDSVPSWNFGIPFAYRSDWGITDLKDLINNSVVQNTKKVSILEFDSFFASPLIYVLPEDLGIDVEYYIKEDKGIIAGDVNLLTVDYVIVAKEEKSISELSVQKHMLVKILNSMLDVKNIGKIILPDNTSLFVYKVEKKSEHEYETDSCNDCSINKILTHESDEKYLKIDYTIPHDKKEWRIYLHKIYERITNFPADYGWVRTSKKLNNLDWSTYSSINFKIKGDKNPSKLEVYIVENDGDYWYYTDEKILQNNEWVNLNIPFEYFKNTLQVGNRIQLKGGDGKKKLDNIIELQLFFISFDTGTKKTVYFTMFNDEIFYLK